MVLYFFIYIWEVIGGHSLFQKELWNPRYILKKIWYIESLPKNPHRNKWTMGDKIGVPIAQGLDVPNFLKDVSNIMKDVANIIKDIPNFVKNVPREPKSILK